MASSSSVPTIIPHEILQLRHIFGINSAIPNSLHLLQNDKLLYVAGYYAVAYNPREKEKSQSYYSGADGFRSITSVCISSSKKQMAMGLRGESKPLIFYYELNVAAKRKKIEFPEAVPHREWVSVAFASGNETKYMASLSNKNGDSIVAFWSPEKSKLLAWTKIPGHPAEKDLIEVTFSPNTSSSQNQIVSILGEKTFRICKIVELEDKSYQFQDVATEITGKDVTAPLKCHLYLATTPQVLVLAESELMLVDQTGNWIGDIPLRINGAECLANWSEGFAVGGVNGVAIYSHDEKGYTYRHTIEIGDKQLVVKSISIYDNKLAILLNTGGILQTKLKGQPNKTTFEQVGLQFHNGPIVSMDVCVRKPLVATAGKDKCIKIWNYEEKTVETTRNETQAALCLSFHPSGLHLVIAYSDKLRMANVQKDGEALNGYKDINSFKNCSEIKFSNGGHYFAAVSGTSVHVFKFYTGENPPGMTFSGHTGKIRCIAWSKEDNFLVTCGSDGIILAYRVGMEGLGSKLVYIHNSKELRHKGISYSCVTITNNNKIYAVGGVSNSNERVFKEVLLDGSDVRKDLPQNNAGQIAFPSSGRLMIAGTDDKERSSGSLKCYRFPLSQHFEEFPSHDERGIQKIRVTSDDKYVISAGRDGCLMVFEIKDQEARGDKLKDSLAYSNEVLVMKSDLDSLKTEIEGLRQQEGAQSMIVPAKDEAIKQLKDKYESDSQQDSQKYNTAVEKKLQLKKKYEEQIKTKKEEFENSLQQYDSNQSKNVMQESAHYDTLKRTQELENMRYEKEIQQNKEQYEREMKALEDSYRRLIEKERANKLDLEKAIELEHKKHEETMRQISQEKLDEVNKLDTENEKQVDNLTQASLKANSEVSITTKKISEKKQEQERNSDSKKENDEKIARLKDANLVLNHEIAQQKEIIQDKDKRIGQNEKTIYELKKRSQELQKFKYVLDHKIKELKKDIGPREREINDMKVKTNKMDKKLKDYNADNSGLAEFVSELFKNEESLKSDIAKQRSRISYQNVKIKQFKDAVYQSVQFIQNEDRLKQQAAELNRKFVTHSIKPVEMDGEIEQEYKNQKKYLEKSVQLLKRNLLKDHEIHKQDNIRIMKGNVSLIRDINDLRMITKDGAHKKGGEDEKKKLDPLEDQLKKYISEKTLSNSALKKQMQDLEQRIAQLDA